MEMGQPNNELKENILCVCWGIRKGGNEKFWKDRMMGMIYYLFLQWKLGKVQMQHNQPHHSRNNLKWGKPPEGTLKINYDAAQFKSDNCSS